jgi:class I fructose-bisphosphate aldolase
MATELKRGTTSLDRIEELLGDNARTLLDHQATAITRDQLNLPGPDFIDRVWSNSDRSPAVLRSLQTLFDNGRLAKTGYLSILPVDQGIEHSAGASFAPNPQYFDPENIVKLAIEGGCNAVASTFGVLGTVARKYAHKIPFIVKINHNELLTLPNKFDQVLFGTVKEAHNMGAVAIGATIYFGSEESTRQITEISAAFAVLLAQLKIQNPGRRHACRSRPHRPGKSFGRNHSGRYHQAETSRTKRRLSGS